MTRTTTLFVCLLGLAAATLASASASVPLVNWEHYGLANQYYVRSVHLDTGRHYSASLAAPDRYWNGGYYAPDMDLYVVNPVGQVHQFTRYGDEHVDFQATHTGTYRFYAVPRYGNGTFRLRIARIDW